MNKPDITGAAKVNTAALILSIAVLSMVLFGGIAMYYSVSTDRAGTLFNRLMKWEITGVIGAIAVYLYGYRNAVKGSIVFLIISLILLVLARASTPVNGAHTWVLLPGFSIQPSRYAMLALMLFIAHCCSVKQELLNSFSREIIPLVAAIAVTCGLLIIDKDYGTAVMLVVTVGIVLAAAAGRFKYLLTVPVALALIFVLAKCTGLDMSAKVSGYRTWNALMELGSGSWSGLGFAAVLLAFLGYVVIVLSSFYIAVMSKDRQGMLLGVGISSMLALQAVISMVGAGTFMIRGITAPFIGYGGSNLIMSLICVGLILSIAMDFDICKAGESSEDEW